MKKLLVLLFLIVMFAVPMHVADKYVRQGATGLNNG